MLGNPNNLRDKWRGLINELLSMASVRIDNLILFLLLIPYQTPKLLYAFFWVIPQHLETPGNYPKERIQHTEHSESFKSRIPKLLFMFIT